MNCIGLESVEPDNSLDLLLELEELLEASFLPLASSITISLSSLEEFGTRTIGGGLEFELDAAFSSCTRPNEVELSAGRIFFVVDSETFDSDNTRLRLGASELDCSGESRVGMKRSCDLALPSG